MCCVKAMVCRILFILMSLRVFPSTSAAASEKWTWFLSNQLYYMLYDDVTSVVQARDLCGALSDARLAIFDDDVSLNDVSDYLLRHYSSDEFWVDAELKVPGEVNYTWANNCTLPGSSPLWGPSEPASDHALAILKSVGASVKYFAANGSHSARPLCQSARAPTNYLPTPPTLTWVSLGNVGHMFGFSNDMRSFAEAKTACEQQAGKVYLADLEMLTGKVKQYLLNNHPGRTYWVNAKQLSNTGSLSTTWDWPSGSSVASSLYYTGDYSSLVMVKQNSAIKLAPSLGASLNYYVCKGNPAPESTTSASPPSLTWTALGTPSRLFGFSSNSDRKSFADAREACAAQTGRGTVRLAVLDTLRQEVMDWIQNNQPSSQFWVDASRPTESADFLWGDGEAVAASDWARYEPDGDDLVGRFLRDNSVIMLKGTSTYSHSRNFVCEQVPEVTLEWRLLGSPPELFGFSRTQSWGLDWARRACSSQLGDVKLASLESHFNDVITALKDHYPNDQFWVDATLPSGAAGSAFHWDNGVGAAVDSGQWLSGEPSSAGDTVARITKGSGVDVGLASHDDPLEPYYFVCQGQPASPVMTAQFSSPCQVVEFGDDCSCNYTNTSMSSPTPSPGVNVSQDDKDRAAEAIRKELLLDTYELSSTVRKLSSAEDSRPSARALGGLGIAILAVTAFIVVAPDLLDLVRLIARKASANRAPAVRERERGQDAKGDVMLKDVPSLSKNVNGDLIISDP